MGGREGEERGGREKVRLRRKCNNLKQNEAQSALCRTNTRTQKGVTKEENWMDLAACIHQGESRPF